MSASLWLFETIEGLLLQNLEVPITNLLKSVSSGQIAVTFVAVAGEFASEFTRASTIPQKLLGEIGLTGDSPVTH